MCQCLYAQLVQTKNKHCKSAIKYMKFLLIIPKYE